MNKKSKHNSSLELEFNKSSLILERLRKEYNCIDISNDIWVYSKNLLRSISKKFLKRFEKKMSLPKIDFIDESIEMRWIKDDFKVILSISDYINDIIGYVRISKDQYFSLPIPKNEIIGFVLFWLNRF